MGGNESTNFEPTAEQVEQRRQLEQQLNGDPQFLQELSDAVPDIVLDSPFAQLVRRAAVAEVIPRGSSLRHAREFYTARTDEEREEVRNRHMQEYRGWLGDTVEDEVADE